MSRYRALQDLSTAVFRLNPFAFMKFRTSSAQRTTRNSFPINRFRTLSRATAERRPFLVLSLATRHSPARRGGPLATALAPATSRLESAFANRGVCNSFGMCIYENCRGGAYCSHSGTQPVPRILSLVFGFSNFKFRISSFVFPSQLLTASILPLVYPELRGGTRHSPLSTRSEAPC